MNAGEFAKRAAKVINISSGYGFVNWGEYVRNVYSGRAASRLYAKKTLEDYTERMGTLPNYQRLCSEILWIEGKALLGPRASMEQIAEGFRSIYKSRIQ